MPDPVLPNPAHRSPPPTGRCRGAALLLLGLALAVVCLPLRAATPWENRAYEVVLKLFEDGIYELAAREAEEFMRRYPGSEKESEVALVRAQAQIALKRFDQAILVLTQRLPEAGSLADEYTFWLAEARLQQGELSAAADAFAALARDHPESRRRFEASYAEALARFRQGDFPRAIQRLRDPDGPFQSCAAEAPEEEWVLRGMLLLGEALLRQREYAAAETALESIAERNLPAALDWQRSYLLSSVQFADGRIEPALAHVTNLWTVATNVVRPDLLAEAAVLEGQIHEQLGDLEAAVRAYERNFSPRIPRAWRQAALQRLIDIGLNAGRDAETAARLVQFVQRHPNDELLDLARFTLGELRLAEYRSTRAAGEPALERLDQARLEFERVVRDFPQSPLASRAWLNLGWCHWIAEPPRLAPAAEAFRAAAERLPRSLPQVEARLKWADCQFRLGDPASAMTNYWMVATNYLDLDGLATNTVAQALYQVVRAGVEIGDLPGAAAGWNRLLATAPEAELSRRAPLLLGEAYNRLGNPAAARAVYRDFLERFTNSTRIPEARLGLARTYERARELPSAIEAYQQWLAAYSNQPAIAADLTAQVSFDLARLKLLTDPTTNGVVLLASFIEAFPTNVNVALAQYLLGERHFRQGDFGRAELHFLDRSLSRPDPARLGQLPYQARLMAGRAAVARQSYRIAREHFDWIITNGPLHVADSPISPGVAAQAYLLRGDTFLAEPPRPGSNPLDSFGEAITAYAKVAEQFPTNELAPLAWGRIGDCQLQLATQDPRRYLLAAEAYRRVINSGASASARSMAEVGLAVVFEKQTPALPEASQADSRNQALSHYLEVFYGKNLRDGETADPYWVKRAGLAAIDLAESLQRQDLAIGLCQRLMTELPPLRPRLEKRVSQLQASLPSAR